MISSIPLSVLQWYFLGWLGSLLFLTGIGFYEYLTRQKIGVTASFYVLLPLVGSLFFVVGAIVFIIAPIIAIVQASKIVKAQRGFTLIELMIATGILGIFAVIIISVIQNFLH